MMGLRSVVHQQASVRRGMLMLEGILVKGYSGFYYVYAEKRVWECSLRGRFRLRDQEFLPGDRVKILPGTGRKATIEEVLPRRNCLSRPPVANIDQAVLVLAATSPDPDFNLLDRLLVQAAAIQVNALLVVTKQDLEEPNEERAAAWQVYSRLGYPVIRLSNKTGAGIAELQAYFTGKTSVLAGPSGVGKSSLLNSLVPGLELKVGQVGRKLQRGRHTTRHVELLPCSGGLVADTPGFSSLYLPTMRREQLAGHFPEFHAYLGQCRFASCLHAQEPDCAVKTAVAAGEIAEFRYRHYLDFLEEVIAAERRY